MRLLREALLWTGALFGVLGVGVWLAVAVGGLDLLVVRSGSMSPAIDTGSLALARSQPAASAQRGDVVSVVADSGARITHRVVTRTVRGERTELVLKGDANARPDAEVYDVGTVQRVVAHVPYAGYVVARALTVPGAAALGSVLAMILVLGFTEPTRTTRAPRPPPRRRRARPRRRVLGVGRVAAVLVVACTGVILTRTSGTWAAFTDAATVRSDSFGAALVGPPTGLGCVAGTFFTPAAVSWGPPSTGPSPTAYEVTATGAGEQGGVVSASSWRPTANGTWTVSVRTRAGSWLSQPSPSVRIQRSSFLGIAAYRCV